MEDQNNIQARHEATRETAEIAVRCIRAEMRADRLQKQLEMLLTGMEALVDGGSNPDASDVWALLESVAASDSLGYLSHVESELQSRIATLEADLRAANNTKSIYREVLDAAQARCAEELDVLRSQLATVTADRDWFREALGDCVTAMTLWGSQEDGVPEAGEDLMGSIGKAYDNAKAMLRWPDDPTVRKPAPTTQSNPTSAPEPKSLTAEECEQALRRGDAVRVSSMPSPYRVRGGVLETLKGGGLWRLSVLDVRDIVDDVRNGAECFLVREGE